ncbi:MAG: MFS transporter [Planctomycetaceae bacterium]|nr:MFS transporter [Planctomycetaceae bacterium]
MTNPSEAPGSDESADSSEATAYAQALHDPWSALRIAGFRRYLAGNVFAALGMQMQTVAVGWEVWERTHDALLLGLVGLVQFLPVITLLLPAGHAADRFPRKRILFCCLALLVSSSLGLALISVTGGHIRWMFACLLLTGIARAFQQPTKASFLPQIVPRERFNNAVTWSTGGFHLASVLGPAVGGLVIAAAGRAAIVYALDAAATLIFLLLLLGVPARPQVLSTSEVSVRTLLAGLRFVYHTKTILAAITLDMFAVLLGGATMLFPIFASPEMLDVGPTGLGWMRAAPAIGALSMSFALAYRPPIRRAGPTLLWSVVGFGVAMIVFGLSRWFPLSLAALFLSGALDNISVVIRHTLVQMQTPDAMRGRVSAVNSLFIGASNELGGFESGLVARLTSPVISVVLGGIGTLIVVGLSALAWPEIRRYGRLDGTPEAPAGLPAGGEGTEAS